jgi:hypothetical protein
MLCLNSSKKDLLHPRCERIHICHDQIGLLEGGGEREGGGEGKQKLKKKVIMEELNVRSSL